MARYTVYFRAHVWKALKRARKTHKLSTYINELLERELDWKEHNIAERVNPIVRALKRMKKK